MTRQYTSFLIRCWRLDGEEQRIKVEHIGSGASTQAATLEAALGWMAAWWGAMPLDSAVVPGRLASRDDMAGAAPVRTQEHSSPPQTT